MSSITHLPPPGGHPQGNTLPTLYQQHGVAVYNPYTQAEHHDDEIDLRKLWRIVSKYRWTIIAVFLISVVTTGIVSLLTQPMYRAAALIEVQPDRSIVKFQNLDQQTLTDREYLTTQMNILSSESVSNAVIDGMDLPKDPEFNGEFAERGLRIGLGAVKDGIRSALEAVKSLFGGESVGTEGVAETSMFQVPPEVIKRRELLQRYQVKLNVEQVTKSDLIRVSMDSYSPVKAAALANAHTEAYVLLSENRRFDSTSGAKLFLQKQIEESQANLEASEKALTDFARKRNIVDVEDRSNYMETRLSELNQALTEARQKRITAEVAFRQAEQGDIGSIPTVLEGDLIKVLREDLAEFEAEYREKSRVFKETYPAMQQLKAKIDDLHASLDRESRRLVVGLQNTYEQLVAEESRLEEQVDKQQGQMLDLKDRAIAYNILKRAWEADKEMFSGLLEKQKDVSVASGMEINNLTIVDRASIPVEKHTPKTALNVAIAGVFGLMAGLGIAFLLAFMDNTFRNGEDLEAVLGLTFLGMVPWSKPKGKGEHYPLHVASEMDRLGQMAESIRSIRTAIQFSRPDNVPKRILITSTTSGEGKSTIATNLALLLAQNGSRTLILEADLRRPNIARWLEVPERPGLTEYLTDTTKADIVKATRFENLYCISSGSHHANPAELLGSKRMDDYVKTLSGYFDYVIFDGPPVLGLADSLVLSSKVDGVVVVVKSGETSQDAVKESVKRLRTVNAPIIGTVLNYVDLSQREYGYYNTYYYGYGDPDRKQITDDSRQSA